MYENYRSETFVQQCAQMVKLMRRYPDVDWKNFVLGYDDMCHFDAFCHHKDRIKMIEGVTDVLAAMRKIIDDHHIKGHQNNKIKKRACGMKYKRDRFEDMVDVYDEVCEGSFSWFSGFRNIVISMDPQMFKCLTSCLLHFKNVKNMKQMRDEDKISPTNKIFKFV